jgi:hypothetical protein
VAQPPTDATPTDATKNTAETGMTKAQAARAAKVRVEDVLSYRAGDGQVTVVTVDGQKIRAAL